MNDCRRTVGRLAPFIDRELPSSEQKEVEQHLGACPPCRAVAEQEEGGRTVLRGCADRLRTTPLPPGLRTRCEALAREHAARSARPAWRRRLLPALVVTLLLVFTATTVVSLATRRSNTLLAAQLTLDHLKCFKVFDPADDVSADARSVEAMLADEYGWHVRVPPSSPANGVTLVGARRCVYSDGSIPHVMYHVDGEDMSLYVLEGIARSAADVVTLGYQSRIWSRGATTYVLVSPAADASRLTRAARYVMQEAH